MQRILSPSRRPFDNGAARWQQRSSSATTLPSASRQRSSGTRMSVRASIVSAAISCDHAATYQVFLRKAVAVLTREAPLLMLSAFCSSLPVLRTDWRAECQCPDQLIERPIEGRREIHSDHRLDLAIGGFDSRRHTRCQRAAARRERNAQAALIVIEAFAPDVAEFLHARQHARQAWAGDAA